MNIAKRIKLRYLVHKACKPKGKIETYMVKRAVRGKVGEFHAAVVRAESASDAIDLIMGCNSFELGYWKPKRNELVVTKVDNYTRGILLRVRKS